MAIWRKVWFIDTLKRSQNVVYFAKTDYRGILRHAQNEPSN